jgi:hypothetical protein
MIVTGTACGQFQRPEEMPALYRHPELMVYVNEFLDEAELRGINLRRNFDIRNINVAPDSELEPQTIGVCITRSRINLSGVYQWRQILVRESYFKKYKNDPYEMRMLMFHELGHCILDRDHSDHLIMQATAKTISATYLERYWDHHVDELFFPGASIFVYDPGQYYPQIKTLALRMPDDKVSHEPGAGARGACNHR